MGSSHGVNRIIRLAYFEDPSYVPLLRRAYQAWREVEQRFGEQLLVITGSIDAGPPGSRMVEGSQEACREHDIPHEVLTGRELAARFPGYQLPGAHIAVLQADGGFVASERAVVAHATLAQHEGATIRAREKVLDWEPTPGGGVRVQTDRSSYEAGRLVVSAGAWVSDFVPRLRDEAVPERQVLGWFQPEKPELFGPERFPVFNMIVDEGQFYGFPAWGVPGFKIGRWHHLHETGHADVLSREATLADEAVLRDCVARHFPAASGPTMALRASSPTRVTSTSSSIDFQACRR
jgi:sarcosine oxidase